MHIWGFDCVHLVFFDFDAPVGSVSFVLAYNQNIIQPFWQAYDRERLNYVVDEIVSAIGNGEVGACKNHLSHKTITNFERFSSMKLTKVEM